jgi:transposase-like protein
VQDVAVFVAEDLHLDVLRARDVFLEKHRGISERPLRLALRFVEQRIEITRLVHHAHAASRRRRTPP